MSSPIPPTYKTRNWPAYNEALKRRGSLTVWFDAEMIWKADRALRQGNRLVKAFAAEFAPHDPARQPDMVAPRDHLHSDQRDDDTGDRRQAKDAACRGGDDQRRRQQHRGEGEVAQRLHQVPDPRRAVVDGVIEGREDV